MGDLFLVLTPLGLDNNMLTAIVGIYTVGWAAIWFGQMIYSDVEMVHIPLVHVAARSLFWPIVLVIFLFKCFMWVISEDDRWLE